MDAYALFVYGIFDTGAGRLGLLITREVCEACWGRLLAPLMVLCSYHGSWNLADAVM